MTSESDAFWWLVSRVLGRELNAKRCWEVVEEMVKDERYPGREKVLWWRSQGMTQLEISNRLGITRERVRQIEGKQLRRVRFARGHCAAEEVPWLSSRTLPYVPVRINPDEEWWDELRALISPLPNREKNTILRSVAHYGRSPSAQLLDVVRGAIKIRNLGAIGIGRLQAVLQDLDK